MRDNGSIVGETKGTEVCEKRLLGGSWIEQEYGLSLVQALRHQSFRSGRLTKTKEAGRWLNGYPDSYCPEDSLIGHLEFMLKHESVSLELLSRLFSFAGKEDIEGWIRSQPTGKFARRAAWLFEWLTGTRLDAPDSPRVKYVDALDSDRYWTAPGGRREPRFSIRSNLPGTPDLCPLVVLEDLDEDVDDSALLFELEALQKEFGEDLLSRAVTWLTHKESRSSFLIEREEDSAREERFANAMQNWLGRLDDVFGRDLVALQQEVLGQKTQHLGIRKSPIYVGEYVRHVEKVHYITPCFQGLDKMMTGLTEIESRTRGTSSVIRSAVLSFLFVYIHPLCDGNGRISRFLVNDVLRRDAVLPEPFVIPVSAAIAKDMPAYDRALESFSRPLLRKYRDKWKFGQKTRYDDGEFSNFEFDSYDDADHAWRFIDLTHHVNYLFGVLLRTMRSEVSEEAAYLRRHYQMRQNLKQIIELGDSSLDRIIRSVSQVRAISGALKGDFPLLDDDELCKRVVRAVLSVLDS